MIKIWFKNGKVNRKNKTVFCCKGMTWINIDKGGKPPKWLLGSSLPWWEKKIIVKEHESLEDA